ncbi:signal peptide peptidase SppA [Devosia sp. ZB163]|uniref:signal peptide peptidase SppA n=1 Tax=Devosia sp. ZB163 TaxID=3025938 RepID=UPI00235F7CD4|nr:signal peptide peptidase SppA [Devosia sp. ZB163]MDC9822902.1 signal peptide peptidase SppA [Devosia sp. ZB163]
MTDLSAESAHQIAATRKLRRSRRIWRVLFFVAMAAAVLAIVGRFSLEQGGPGERIARVTINGTITSDHERVKTLQRLAEDDGVKAVIVAINSPGGTTAGGEELYESLGALRAKKPVVSVINELGASAAYMAAIGTDRIYARRLSIVGSIGVLYQHVNAGKLLSTIGVDLDKVQTGPLKAEPDLDEPLEGEARASLQSLVNDSFEWFVDIVSERRGIPRPQTLVLSDGRIVTGRQGLDFKLIDAIGGEAEAIAWLESDRSIKADLPVVDAFPRPDTGLGSITRWLGQSAAQMVRSSVDEAMSLDGLVSLWHAQPSM